jgi:hypothetical protein
VLALPQRRDQVAQADRLHLAAEDVDAALELGDALRVGLLSRRRGRILGEDGDGA